MKKIDKKKIDNHKYYLKNKELVKKRAKKWALENLERRKGIYTKNNQKSDTKIRKHKWYLEYKQITLDRVKRWAKNNPEKRKEIALKWFRKKYKNDLSFVLHNRISGVLYNDLKRNKAGKTWKSILDFTIEDLKNHLEKQFTEKMTWKKFMCGDIHIDHIKPRCLFNFTSYKDKEFKKCWDLNNLQPLWAKDNLSKGKKYVE